MLDWIRLIRVQHSGRCHEVAVAFVNKDGIKDINQCLVDEEGFKKQSYDSGALAQDKKDTINPS